MKKWFIGLGIFAVVLVLAFFLRQNPVYDNQNIETNNPLAENSDQAIQDSSESSTETDEDLTPQDNSISSGIGEEEVSKHNTKDDCWVVYSGKIYDVTDYISRHPGGEDKIARNCGTTTQFQEQFTNKHGTSKVELLMKVGTFIGDFDVIGEL